MGFIVKLVLVLAVVAGGSWVWVVTHPVSYDAAQLSAQNPSAPITGTPAEPERPAVQAASVVTDASLEADLNAYEADAEAAVAEQSAIDSSFNDKPIQQTE